MFTLKDLEVGADQAANQRQMKDREAVSKDAETSVDPWKSQPDNRVFKNSCTVSCCCSSSC